MKSMKERILLAIYNEFEAWSDSIARVCVKGCSTCCSQNVMISAFEGERILDFIRKKGDEQWCAGRLQSSIPTAAPTLTANEFAAAYLQQQEVEGKQNIPTDSRCPFLEKDCCSIYPVRPFACRCFLSEKPCKAEGTAVLPEHYLAAATAMMQLIEHLGQNEYWGNMVDVLLALCDLIKFKEISRFLPDNSVTIKARLRTRKAQALPGFLFLEAEWEKASPLLEKIFSTRIDDRTLQDILNGER